ncbi:hypothetical protein DSO57_1025222 [Entomophthora muscae]|uniref:Uncharacterized protein n=1 Tax=Entomophthora muscae TaxID=34485 RepID=A0ACC2S475_9FUNG|nr:hypothetical protein DSO57_1025222 [Entomophthora muscae]
MVPNPSVTQSFITIQFNTTFGSKSSLDAEQKAVEEAGSLSHKIDFYESRQQTAAQDSQAIYQLVMRYTISKDFEMVSEFTSAK